MHLEDHFLAHLCITKYFYGNVALLNQNVRNRCKVKTLYLSKIARRAVLSNFHVICMVYLLSLTNIWTLHKKADETQQKRDPKNLHDSTQYRATVIPNKPMSSWPRRNPKQNYKWLQTNPCLPGRTACSSGILNSPYFFPTYGEFPREDPWVSSSRYLYKNRFFFCALALSSPQGLPTEPEEQNNVTSQMPRHACLTRSLTLAHTHARTLRRSHARLNAHIYLQQNAANRLVSNYALLLSKKGAKSSLRSIKQKKLQKFPWTLTWIFCLGSVKRNSKVAYWLWSWTREYVVPRHGLHYSRSIHIRRYLYTCSTKHFKRDNIITKNARKESCTDCSPSSCQCACLLRVRHTGHHRHSEGMGATLLSSSYSSVVGCRQVYLRLKPTPNQWLKPRVERDIIKRKECWAFFQPFSFIIRLIYYLTKCAISNCC